jgi:hypothetical protein
MRAGGEGRIRLKVGGHPYAEAIPAVQALANNGEEERVRGRDNHPKFMATHTMISVTLSKA